MAEPKPIFALDLSNDGIALWHRSGSAGWTVFGQVNLEDHELLQKMGELHGKAVAMHGSALKTVVRIPRSEVMMSRLKLGVFEGEAAESHARKLVRDLTPYALDEVAYDVGPKGAGNMAPVAIVARKTLKEAEEFATSHGFNPIYFSTFYSSREFSREPRFYLNPPKPSKMPLISRTVAAAAIGLTLGYFGYSTFWAPEKVVPDTVAVQEEKSDEPQVVEESEPEQSPTLQEQIEVVAPSDQPPNDPHTLLAALAAPVTTPDPELLVKDAKHRITAKPERLARVVPDTNIALPIYQAVSYSDKTDELQLAEAYRDLPDVGLNDAVILGFQDEMSIAELPEATAEAPIVVAALTAPDIKTATEAMASLPTPQIGHGAQPSDATQPADRPDPPPSLVFADPGTLTPTPEGTLGPENILIFSGRPQLVPPDRPSLTPPADPLAGFRARPRPAGLAPEIPSDAEITEVPEEAPADLVAETDAEQPDGAGSEEPSLLALANPELAGLKARVRPDNLKIIDVPETFDLLALADPALSGFRAKRRPAGLKVPEQKPDAVETPAGAEDPETPLENTLDSATKLAVAKSIKPLKRPAKLAKLAVQATEEKSTATAITPDAAKGTARPAPGPTPTTVAKAATEKGRFNKRKMSLVGVFGTPNDRRALVRLPSGRYLKVKKGDRLSGWKVSAIGESSVRIRKGSKDQVLRMP
ncbi:MAG: type IV pilus biogenesis protein PilP [Rhodobacteraceae bacterium]|nr:type IV pilus biogenesis protein PilP [Paracoccaceae bacterium]